MRVVVPHSDLHPVTRQIMDSYNLPVEYVQMHEAFDYCRLLRKIWSERKTVVLVEQDIVPWPGAVEELYHCLGLWCACSYRYDGGYGLYHGLGCTKISGRLMDKLPDLWKDDYDWGMLDRILLFAARDIGQEPHPHRPPVIHLSTKH